MSVEKLPYISGPNEITNNDYHNGDKYNDFLSSTKLKYFLTSPKWYKWLEDHPEDEEVNLAYQFGGLYHSMLASIVNTGDLNGFKDDHAIFIPPINQTTGKPYGITSGAYLTAYNFAKEQSGGKELCTQDQIDLAQIMINELMDGNPHLSKDIQFLIRNGKAEESGFCEYQGYKFKYRTDLKTKSKIVDWKTCAKDAAHPEEIHRQIIKFNYHISAAFYQFFDFQITGKWKPFFWIFQEKESPFDFLIESADNWAFEITKNDDGSQIALPKCGAVTFIKLMEQYILCRESDIWPGYSIFVQPGFRNQRINYSQPPGYYKKLMFNFFN